MSVNSDNRIVYVNPYDIYGSVNGEPQTPDYTDYCMYCNLLVEPTSRLKNSYSGLSSDGNFSITSNLQSKGVNYISFFQGKSDDYNYLTTDYTDIHFNTVREKTFVEGLQITGIDISYDRFTPIVTLNLTDIRGAGLFGREEATHVNGGISNLEKNKEDEIIDNIYSSFMTFPYPRFKLHIKGYYGRAVTYQLTCSGFNSKFDSSTGNFNITCTFIAYEFGCLQDIPLSYIIAAPYTKVGREYWNSKVNSPEWNLFKNGGHESPVKLREMYQAIDSQIPNYTADDGDVLNALMPEDLTEIQNEYNIKTSYLVNIEHNQSEFIAGLKSANPSTKFVELYNDDDKEGDYVVCLLNNTGYVFLDKTTSALQRSLGETINKYNNSYSNDNIKNSMLPNSNGGKWDDNSVWDSGNLLLRKAFVRDRNNTLCFLSSKNGNQILVKKENDLNNSRALFNKLNTDDTYSFNSYQSTVFVDAIKKMGMNVPQYCSVIVFKNWNIIKNKTSELKTKLEEYQNKINNGELIPITNLTGGITPYIGNYYKTIFCHIDTFLYTIWKCASDIYDTNFTENRSPSNLGIRDINETDVPNSIYYNNGNGVIPPFPAIYRNYKGNTTHDAVGNESIKNVGWVGNVEGGFNWREKELIEDYYNALRNIDSNISNRSWKFVDKVDIDFNVLPFFIQDSTKKDLFYTREGMAYYISNVLYVILGVINTKNVSDTEAEAIGSIIAEKFYNECSDKSKLSNEVEGGSLSNDLYDIATISNVRGNNDTKYFEFSMVENGRHPIMKNVGDKMVYTYMKTNSGVSPLIPINSLDDWQDIRSNYKYFSSNGQVVFTPIKVIDGDYIIGNRVSDFVDSTSNIKQDDYQNYNMFSVWLDACNVENLIIQYEDYKDNGFDIGNVKKDKIKKYILKKYWLMDDNYELYQKTTSKDEGAKRSHGYKSWVENDYEGLTKENIDSLISYFF